MKIPMPYNEIKGVSWFKWSDGLEYTYNTPKGLVCVKNAPLDGADNVLEVKDEYLADGPFKDKGYPLRGTGYLFGLDFRNGKTYADLIMSSRYMTHVKVEVKPNGDYDGGEIIFPPSVDTDEQKQRIAASSYFNRNMEE